MCVGGGHCRDKRLGVEKMGGGMKTNLHQHVQAAKDKVLRRLASHSKIQVTYGFLGLKINQHPLINS